MSASPFLKKLLTTLTAPHLSAIFPVGDLLNRPEKPIILHFRQILF